MNILYCLPTYNIYGGTPKKTLDLMKHFKENSTLYVYQNEYQELKKEFEKTNANIYEGFFGKNLFKHIKLLLEIIDKHHIKIVQTQFFMGELLGYAIKIFRPEIKLIIAFVGAIPASPIKKKLSLNFYKKADVIVFISEYVKKERTKQFPILEKLNTFVIHNGTRLRIPTSDDILMKSNSILSVSGLVYYKNIDVLIDAMNIIVNEKKYQNVYFYVAGDGPEKNNLEKKILGYNLGNNVYLLGYQKNIGGLLKQSSIYVHSCYVEGFGIAVAEAMMAGKPIIVSDAGALPELIENEKTGLVIDPFDAKAWAEGIIKLIENKSIADQFGENAAKRAQIMFSIKRYIENYKSLYNALLEDERC